MFHRLHLTFVHVDLPVIFFFFIGYFQVLRVALVVRALRVAARVYAGSA
jgi:hypothetical protein